MTELIKLSEYSREYERLSNLGYSYFQIKKLMEKEVRKDYVNGKEKPIRDKDDYVDHYERSCGKCKTPLKREHFYFETVCYSATLFYKCPVCKKFNRFVE